MMRFKRNIGKRVEDMQGELRLKQMMQDLELNNKEVELRDIQALNPKIKEKYMADLEQRQEKMAEQLSQEQ